MYCDFFSQTDFALKDAYVDAVLEEFKKYAHEKFDTVYVGGGTPTALGDSLLRLCENLPKASEFSVEANPGTVDDSLLVELKKSGANRLSIGVQSFNDNELAALGRIHNGKQAREAFEQARKAGFENISVDLMLSVPGQSVESVKKNLSVVKELSPEHVSAYSLIIEEGTPFYSMELDLPEEDEEREIYYTVCEELGKMGYEQYEISNFAKKGMESRHNIKYWTGAPYIGIGAGAHSYSDGVRKCNGADLKGYIQGKRRVENREEITPEEALREKFWLGLRMTRGVKYYGEFPEQVEKLVRQGLLEIKDGYLRLTARGIDLGNVVFCEFV